MMNDLSIKRFCENIETTARYFYTGFEAEGNHYLEKCINWLLVSSNENSVNDNNLHPVLMEIYEAQRRRDNVWIADLLLYSLMQLIMESEKK